jgi:hypothetical protein
MHEEAIIDPTIFSFFFTETAGFFAPFSRFYDAQTHYQKAQMHVDACAPLLQNLHCSPPLSFCITGSWRVSVLVQCLLRALTRMGVHLATGSGSSRHQSAVSKTRSSGSVRTQNKEAYQSIHGMPTTARLLL